MAADDGRRAFHPALGRVERRDEDELFAPGGAEVLEGPHPDLLDRFQAIGHERWAEHGEALDALLRELDNLKVRVGLEPGSALRRDWKAAE